LVDSEKKVLRSRQKLPKERVGSQRLAGSDFQTVELTTEKARRAHNDSSAALRTAGAAGGPQMLPTSKVGDQDAAFYVELYAQDDEDRLHSEFVLHSLRNIQLV